MLGQLGRNKSGAAAAEMALVAPLLIALMFGTMELGYYFYSEHVVVKAVRDGARFASRAKFDDFDCGSNTIDASLVTSTQKVTRTDQVASGGTARLAGWTSDATVSVTMRCDTSGTYGSFYDGLGGVPVVIVSATVPYTSLFSSLGFNVDELSTSGDVRSPGDGYMMSLRIIRRLWTQCDGAIGAEFALVFPTLLLFLLGIIDVGRYMWSINQLEKATQIGARMAVVTDMIPGGLGTSQLWHDVGAGRSQFRQAHSAPRSARNQRPQSRAPARQHPARR